MSSAQPVPSSTRRNRDASHAEVPIGRYIRLDQIGRGSFATVYQGVHAVCFSVSYGFMFYSMLICSCIETSILRRYQIGQSIETQQETQGESLVGNRYLKRPPSSAYCRFNRLP